MNADRRILTPITASIVAGVLVAAATLGGSMASDAPARKGDRFKIVSDTLCANQSWPNITSECLAWSEGEASSQHVRFITIADHDAVRGVSTLTRVSAAGVTN
ncbi:hypothetical protein [Acuticoccus mangrovi]|uniref:Uncharacterized protein n=1 Tax=Acuticoccus mangrovi TaxID=2796142 RepID=A0A934IM17_9HYPH|nr:hypothetical protein [Acuticoccus mangrovi]MBJ3775115.1 hypothetical protein [Acuticoccus mangrovi]